MSLRLLLPLDVCVESRVDNPNRMDGVSNLHYYNSFETILICSINHLHDQAAGFGGLGLGGLLPSYTVVSSPVTRDTVITETLTEEFKLNFRNQV